MKTLFEKRVDKLMSYHESDLKPASKSTFELGEYHSDALKRICILEGKTQVSMMRTLIEERLVDFGVDIVGDPGFLYRIIEQEA